MYSSWSVTAPSAMGPLPRTAAQLYTHAYTDGNRMSRGSPRKLLSRAERQESILRGAAAAFAHTGFDGTSMEDVADASGITRLIVYRNFASKEDLYRAVLERVMARLARGVPRRLRAVDRPRLRRAGAAHRRPRRPRRVPAALGARRPRAPLRRLRGRVPRRASSSSPTSSSGRCSAIPPVRRWATITFVDHLYDAVLTWLDVGDPARDDEFVAVDLGRAARPRHRVGRAGPVGAMMRA